MKKIDLNDAETKSPDLVAANLAALRALFPELVTEGPDGVAVNLDVLKQLVGDQTNTEASGRFHTDWLNMMYPRLKLARNLLREDGAIFISIDDGEADNLKRICADVFGEENFLGSITWQKKYAPANDTIDLSATHDYILAFAKSRPVGSDGRIKATLTREERSDEMNLAYSNPDDDERGPWKPGDYTCNKSADERPNLYYAIKQPNNGEDIWPKKTRVWAYSKDYHETNVNQNRVWWGVDGTNKVPSYKRFLTEVGGVVAQTVWLWDEVGHNDEAKKELQNLFDDSTSGFETPKPTKLISRIIRLGSVVDNSSIILDFFAGSGTTGHALYSQNIQDDGNRRFILVQLPQTTERKDYPTIADITKERLRRAGKKIRYENPLFPSDIGFRVFKLASSNIRAWEPDRDKLAETLLDSVEHLKTDRTEQDILFELLLKLGLVAWHKELKPAGETTVVFRDSAFADDVAKTNLTAILQQHGLENVRSL